MRASFIILCALALLPRAEVHTGLDVVVAEHFKIFQGKNIGLITNHTAVDRQGRHIADLFHAAPNVHLKALFGPEHGIRGDAEGGAQIATAKDAKTGVPVYSLYGKTYKPTPEMLAGLDALVFDMQDVGTRFYTYISTLAMALEAAAENNLELYVLDRPNPIGDRVEGAILEAQYRSFIGIHPIALRHGMTIGELAQMFVGEGWATHSSFDSATAQRPNIVWNKLHVISLQNWSRQQFFPETKLPWIAPSPNMTTPNTALLYPGMGLLEATNFSEGRGTEQPFEVVGAPWFASQKVAELLRPFAAGVEIMTTNFTPQDLPGKAMNPKFKGQVCQALRFKITAPEKFESVKLGIALLWALHQTHPNEFTISEKSMARHFGNTWLSEKIRAGATLEELWARNEEEQARFTKARERYLLYKD